MNIKLGPFDCGFVPWRPGDGRVFDFFSFDTETTLIDDERPDRTPDYVLGAACDGSRGVFVSRENASAFFQTHCAAGFIMHNAAFDLKVLDALLKPAMDVYEAVDKGRVWDTLILKRLYSLATAGHTARGEASLAECAKVHLTVDLDKGRQDAHGKGVRVNFGQFLGRPPSQIPAEYLEYLAGDVMATWHLFWTLKELIKDVLQGARGVYGFVNDDWLKDVTQRFGPLTHNIQLRASIVMDALRTNGIGLDKARAEEKAKKVTAMLLECKERMRKQGYLAGERGSDKAMQSILRKLKAENPELELKKTPGGKWSTAEADLSELATQDEFFGDYAAYKAAEKMLSTYLHKMARPRLHPRFAYLLESGRTCCGGGFNLQNLPREKDEKAAANTIRGCFVPAPGRLFIDCDFSQIELVVLGYLLREQLGLPSVLAELVNGGLDVHRLIAGAMLNKPEDEVTKEERNSVKPVSFGRPGGMGVEGLRKAAKNGYGIEMTTEQVEQRIEAYHRLCPELNTFLRDEIDSGLVIADALGLTPALYGEALGRSADRRDGEEQRTQGWLGGMLLKVLREEQPVTKQGAGRPYDPEEIAFFWEQAQRLPIQLKPDLADLLCRRKADKRLWEAVRSWAGRRSVITVTGRLRANATFGGSRNTLFQGAAADGAILALWNVWRAGYKLVDFVHDQIIVESPADDKVHDRVADVERLMKEGMGVVVPGMLVKVETLVSRSLSKLDLDPKYEKSPEPKEVCNEPIQVVA